MKKLVLILILSLTSVYADDTIEFLKWSQSHREMYDVNKKFIKRLLKKAKNGEIQGLELIIAAKSDIRVESKFGHAMFRFVDSDNDPGNDITVSFVADVDTPDMSTVGGITGKYSIFPLFKSMRLFIKQYIKDDGRPLERHLIPSDQSMRDDLIKTLTKWWQDILDGEENVYLTALKKAKKEANKKGKDLYGENNYEIFPMHFTRDDGKEYIYSYGIVETKGQSLENDSQRNSALYYQAYKVAYEKLIPNLEIDEAILNLGQELWKVELSQKLFYINTTDTELALKIARTNYGEGNYKLFTKFDLHMNALGLYAFKIEDGGSLESELKVLKKEQVVLTIKNLEVKGVLSENMGKYTFFSNNCAGAVIKLLKDANFPHKKRVGIQGRVPVKLNKWMSRSLLSPYPAFEINKAEELKVKLSKLLGLKRKEFETYSFPTHQWIGLTKNLQSVEKFLFYNIFEEKLSSDYKDILRSELALLQAPNYNQMHGLELTTSTLYELCEDAKCAKTVKYIMSKYWSKKEIKKIKKLVNKSGNNMFVSKGLLKRPSVIKHLKELGYLKKSFGN
jgi:hypothetical protein